MGLKNTWRVGREEEDFALAQLLAKKYTLIDRNKKYFGIEVDLVVRDSEGCLAVVEVKSAPREAFESVRLSQSQRQRYRRVLKYLCEVEPTYGLLVFSDVKQEIISVHMMFE
ncbi:MAG: YraN family protein [Pseudobdellovibrionaceae bacterium]